MNIAILKDTTESIQLFLGGAVTTNELEWSAFYFDEVSGTQTLSSSNGVSNGTTDVSVIAAPSSGQRVVKEIVVYNADTVSATITVQFVEAANDRRIVTKTLSANSAWVFSDASDAAGGGASDLDGLSDVTLSGVTQGDLLRRGATDWNNTNIGTNEVVARIAGDVEGLAVGASTVVGRKSTGDIVALTPSEGRTVLDVDISGTDNSTNVTLIGTPDYLTLSGQAITRGLIDQTTDITGIVPLANGGSGADLSATGPGVLQQRTNGAVATALLCNFTATVAPATTDDTGSGYDVGSNWYDVTADKAYVCLDATTSAAVWTETTQAGTSGATTALDNLVSVAINESLISDTDSTDSLGSTGIKWLDAFLDRATFDELATPTTPATGDVRLYAKTDGLLYSKDDVGTETLVSGGAGGGSGAATQGATAITSNTTTETTLWTETIGTRTSTQGVRFVTYVLMEKTAGSSTFTLRVKYGATTLFAPAISIGATEDGNQVVLVSGHIMNDNATNSQKSSLSFMSGRVLSSSTTSVAVTPRLMYLTSTEDTTSSVDLVITAQWATASTDRKFQGLTLWSELIG